MNDLELVSWINSLIINNNMHGFYISTEWKHLRIDILKEQNDECQICKSKGLVNEAVTVHHIKHLKKYPQLALTKSNLIAVCKQCHNDLHPEKRKGNKKEKFINEEKW
ncbi:HNH endonuclease [Clostridium sp. WILCCON 0269]|uniref:Putative HNH nuclease YajD n=1 Tax=Candidatus Clostridium eludens TaxID=3381663 RepID=A0ABW8SLQ8_9CLOT